MSQDNKIAITVDPAVKTAFQQKITEALALVAPYLSNVPVSEKKRYATIGQARAGMDEVFLRSMAENPTLVPGFVVMDDVQQDRQFRVDLKDMAAQLQPLVEGLEDSALLAGSDNFMAYSAYYNSVKMAALRDVPGADAEQAKLAPFFPGGRRTAPPAPPTP